MSKFDGALIAAAIVLTATVAHAQDGRPIESKTTTLHIAVHAEVRNAPDIATIGAGVVTQSQTAKTATSDNAQRMTAVFDALKQAGIEPRDLQTTGIRLQPQYAYEQGKAPRLTGYQANNTVTVKLRQLERVGPVLDALVASGANEISGPAFSIDDPEQALDGARKEAIAKAMARAKLYAEAAGMKVTRLARIEEGGGGLQPLPIPVPMRQAALKADTPIAPGEVTLGVNLDVTFELAKD